MTWTPIIKRTNEAVRALRKSHQPPTPLQALRAAWDAIQHHGYGDGFVAQMEAAITAMEKMPCPPLFSNATVALTALLAELDAAGWRVVPKDPTSEMVMAAIDRPADPDAIMYGPIYRAMCAAAPKLVLLAWRGLSLEALRAADLGPGVRPG